MSVSKHVQVRFAGALGLAFLCCLFNSSVAPLAGQAATATVQGTVTDASGSAVPDAKITLKNTGTGATVSANTNGQGRYVVSNLNPGSYDLDATKTGFQTAQRKAVTFNVGAESVIDFALQIGQQTQTVTVEGQAAAVSTTDATVGNLT